MRNYLHTYLLALTCFNMQIKISDPENKYIKLTSQYENHYRSGNGENVQWVVYIDAYPKPDLRW